MISASYSSRWVRSAFKFLPWFCCAGLLVALFLVHWHDSPERFPQDLQWWEGKVLKNFVWHDGDQDILTEDGHYIVVDWPSLLEPGDTFYLLHAAADDGGQRTFFCTARQRESCGSLSLAVNPPFYANTFNQGSVPASFRNVGSMGSEKASTKLSRLGHFVRKGDRGSPNL